MRTGTGACQGKKCSFSVGRSFIYLFNNLFKVDKFTKIQYTYIHKSSQTNWLIKVNYPILQKKKKKKNLVNFW